MLHEKTYRRLNNASLHPQSPKDIHILVCGTYEYYVTRQKDSANVMKLKGVEMGRFFWITQVDPNPACPFKSQAKGNSKQTEKEMVR